MLPVLLVNARAYRPKIAECTTVIGLVSPSARGSTTVTDSNDD